ncbi:kinase-like domain-containing protein [Pelagophyceae sp. CCMP2097]|nr:kinase-like domain-containing protein [Pelagophyceae sp. CCMP2097]
MDGSRGARAPGAGPRRVGSLAMNTAPPAPMETTMNDSMSSTIQANGVILSKTRGLFVDNNARSGVDVVQREHIELLGRLGAGVSAVVRLAQDLRDSKVKYAVKIFNIGSKDARACFFQEVRMLFELDCPALVQFHGAYLDEQRVGVILEFMDAGSLETLLEGHAVQQKQLGRSPGLPEAMLAALLFQVVWGLGYLHTETRLHRDIKPGNILVNSRGECKLGDFGIARDLGGDAIASTMVGTFRYMSPERLYGGDYSYASDVWSVGMVLLEAARGAAVFPPNCTPVDLVQDFKQKGADLAGLALEGLCVSEDVVFFADACLALDAEDRCGCDDLIAGPWLQDGWGGDGPSVDAAAARLAPFVRNVQRGAQCRNDEAAERARQRDPSKDDDDDDGKDDGGGDGLMETMQGSDDDDDDD